MPFVNFGQTEETKWHDRFHLGGNLGGGVGTVTFIQLNPILGFEATEKLHFGLAGNYQYFNNRNFGTSFSIFGGSLFSRYFFKPNAFAHFEYETLNGPWDVFRPPFFIQNVLVGGGYFARLNQNSGISITGLWNINQSIYSPYQNPIIRVGYNLGF